MSFRRAVTSRPAALCSLVLCIVLCWPRARHTFTTNRDLGRMTTITTDEYMTAARWARLRLTLIEQHQVSWYFGQHVWVAYSERDSNPREFRPLVLTDQDPPSPEYLLVAERPIEGTDRTAKLYAQQERWIHWLNTRRVWPPLQRYATVMRPLADGPYSPHNNRLEDVQRLGWPW